MKPSLSYQVYKLTNFAMSTMPRGLLRRMLRALHIRPDIAVARGITQVYPDVFYNPFPSAKEVDVARLKLKRPLPGIKLDLPKAQALLAEIARHSGEVTKLLADRPAALLPTWDVTYPPADTAVLYAMLRHLKPKRYIEVGCGYSSRTSAPRHCCEKCGRAASVAESAVCRAVSACASG